MMGFILPLILGLVVLSFLFLTFIRIMVATESQAQGTVPVELSPNSFPSLGK
jgi:hypothetical protein